MFTLMSFSKCFVKNKNNKNLQKRNIWFSFFHTCMFFFEIMKKFAFSTLETFHVQLKISFMNLFRLAKKCVGLGKIKPKLWLKKRLHDYFVTSRICQECSGDELDIIGLMLTSRTTQN